VIDILLGLMAFVKKSTLFAELSINFQDPVLAVSLVLAFQLDSAL